MHKTSNKLKIHIILIIKRNLKFLLSIAFLMTAVILFTGESYIQNYHQKFLSIAKIYFVMLAFGSFILIFAFLLIAIVKNNIKEAFKRTMSLKWLFSW